MLALMRWKWAMWMSLKKWLILEMEEWYEWFCQGKTLRLTDF